MRRWLILVAGVLAVGSVSAADFDFKGVYIGKSAKPEEIKQKLGVTCSAGLPGYQICNGYVTVAGAFSQMNLMINPQGIVQRIALTFGPSHFEAVEGALIAKFGAPRVEHTTVRNGLGVEFDQQTDSWGEGPGIILRRYAGTTEDSELRFWTGADVEMLDKLNAGDPSDI